MNLTGEARLGPASPASHSGQYAPPFSENIFVAMCVVYDLTALDGQAEALVELLRNLGTVIAPLPGCAGVQVLRDDGEPTRFLFVERWSSARDYEEGSSRLPPTLFAQLKPLLADRPQRRKLSEL
jgi:heme oxygenase (mycobilin-producing)